jgi:hypothetical protein
MKQKFFKNLIIILLSMQINTFVYSQNDCKVLVKEISDTYIGDCKKDLANGQGIAKGTDKYEGAFKKGYPHGKGTYTYADGSVYKGMFRTGKREGEGSYTFISEGKDSILAGIWKEDKFIGKKPEKPYKVTLNRQINRYSFMQKSEAGSNVSVIVKRDGNNIIPPEMILIGSSGTTKTSIAFCGFEYVDFPFEGTVRYVMSNGMSINEYECEFQFVITKPGTWEIILNN